MKKAIIAIVAIVALGIVFVSVLPVVFEYLKARRVPRA